MHSPGAASNFLKDLDNALDSLSILPYHQVSYDNVRCFKVGRFPYLLHYTIDEASQEVNIQAIWHEKKDTPLGK